MLVRNLTELTELHLNEVQISAQGRDWDQAISSSLPNLRVLELSNCGLSGPIHESLAKLQSLSVVQLKWNNIAAPIPGFFANFSNLTLLDLNQCNLQGIFPKEIFQLPTLQSIDLSGNPELHGSLPEFPKNGSLQSLFLSGSNFSGSLPNSIGNLAMLSKLEIAWCNITGPLPKSMANLTELVNLDMIGNNFQGSIPSFDRAKNLESIDLSLNGLTGQFPELSNDSFYSMRILYLGSNNLEGPIPMSIFNFRGLQGLDLSSNNFSDSFPLDGFQHQKNLENLVLSYNNIFLSYDARNFSYPSFPQFLVLSLASGILRTFPSFLRNQSQLDTLDLSDNQIHGEVPNWIWKLKHLYSLNLSCNFLDTLKASSISNITSLGLLDLHSNKFQGQIPTVSSPAAFYLDYSRNGFNSNIPTTIGDKLVETAFISLSSSNLHGFIPRSICTLLFLSLWKSHVLKRVVQILTNNLTKVGMFSKNCNLETLDISENHIQGQFLKSLVNCTKLEVLNLGNNQITYPFPCFLKNTSTLRVLILRSNKFYGHIGCPETSGTWPVLQIIDLANNNFSGEIPANALMTWQAMMAKQDDPPSKLNHLQFQDVGDYRIYYQDTITVINKGIEIELVKILTVFTSIDFLCNKFDGSIPKEIGELKSLYALNLSNNAFIGAIPASLSSLSQLESLDLSKNNLSGQIPPQLTQLTFLSFLNLSYNQLVGRIPSSNQFSTFPEDSFEGNKDLFGPPLNKDDTSRFSPPTSYKFHPNQRDQVDWDLISVEIGFIFGFGIVIGSPLFCKRWRKWYCRAICNILIKIFPQLEERIST
ncbi:receptor-like protein 7 [Rosa rugosa]|uniref:receptor-like protein 7 n=1 Tax=Rosa rugosa TaxID=74645 RepID=UPI002B412520|nr:receptor-like protein 7 [Rosa rugosa]